MQPAAARPIPQRGMTKLMSFTAADRSEAMTILAYYLKNVTPHEFYQRLLMALTNRMILSSDVENLLSALEAIGVVTSSAHVAVTNNVPRHCLRCHQPYLERDNSLRSCTIPHVVQQPIGAEVAARAQASAVICCANPNFATNPDHFQGRHTTLEVNVAYNAINVKTCVERGCFRNVVVRNK
ncbi:hypothetical protein AZE42_09185 [Rhizopogon vesiculosus]|uniref:Uncharacterized protein n=1 Tax=Rhizopogon vesiculosus TaxID=180088 RepID=A0A1J8QTY4_9AGAM|nr:hypothetical protein AZE42_09185 [Rhizopogon vesiculosus]